MDFFATGRLAVPREAFPKLIEHEREMLHLILCPEPTTVASDLVNICPAYGWTTVGAIPPPRVSAEDSWSGRALRVLYADFEESSCRVLR